MEAIPISLSKLCHSSFFLNKRGLGTSVNFLTTLGKGWPPKRTLQIFISELSIKFEATASLEL